MSEIQNPNRQAASVLSEIRNYFSAEGFRLGGIPSHNLFDLSEPFLLYLLSLLRDEAVVPPEADAGEWQNFFERLLPHKIVPLLYWKINRLDPSLRPPAEILSRMSRHLQETKVRMILLELQLKEVVRAFTAAGVPMVVLKGPSLAWSLYPEAALRPSTDIDILIMPEHFPAARELLEKLGYYNLKRKFENEKIYQNEESLVPRNQNYNYRVDLHWALHPYSFTDHERIIKGLFDRAPKINGRRPISFPVLSTLDALCHSALHLVWNHHHTISLIWICDIALLARSLASPADWAVLQQRSGELGARWGVVNALRMAQLWTGLRLPPEFENLAAWPPPSEMERRAWNHLQKEKTDARVIFSLYWSSEWSLRRKAGFLFRAVFPPPSLIQQSYPVSSPWLLPVSYVQRWWRWLSGR